MPPVPLHHVVVVDRSTWSTFVRPVATTVRTLPELLELSLLPTAMMSAALMDESPASRLHDSCIIRLGPVDGKRRAKDEKRLVAKCRRGLFRSGLVSGRPFVLGAWRGKGLVN